MKLEVLGSSGGLARKWSGLPLIHVLRIGYNLLMASAAEAGRAPQLVILTCLLRLSASEGTEWPSFPRVWMCACFNLVDWLDSLSIVTFVFGEVLTINSRYSAAASISFHFPLVRPGDACRFGKPAANSPPTLVQGCL